MTAAHGTPVLIGGFHGENETAQQSPSISDVTVTLARTGSSTDITQGFSQVSTTAGWGTQALDVAPADSNSPANHAIFQAGTTTPITLILTITNNGAADLSLDSIHWIAKKDVANVGPPSGTLTYTSGDLADTDGTGTPFAIANGTVGLDIALSTFLSDTTLANGESAVFTWAHDAPQDPLGNTALRIDNFAISGEVVSGGPDTDPPTPNPMTWASVPAAAGDSSITMTATTATDANGVQYEFTRYASDGVTVLFTSPWQTNATYTDDTGLNPDTEYKYTVKARDTSAALNETDPSTPAASATTDPADTSAPTPDPMTWAVGGEPAAVNDSSITMTATTATDASGVEYQFTRYAADGTTLQFTSPWQDSPTYTDTGLDPETTYSYTVQAQDKSTAQNQTAVSDPPAAATTDAVPVGPVLLGGFDGSNAVNAPIQHPSAVGAISMELDTSLDPSGLNPGNFMQSSSPLWGTTDLEPDAQNTGTHNCVLFKNGPYDLFITVTNTSADKDVTLETLHWRSKRDTNDSDTHATITYISGSLTDSLGTNTEFFLEGLGSVGHDFALSDLMVDRVLAPGETATFSWSIELGGAGVRWDNIALSGTFSSSDFIAWSAQQGWTVGAPGTSGNDDYDLDGLSNDQERLFGLDPMDPGSRNPLTSSTDPASGLLSYTRRTQSLTGMNYPVWFSTDLEEWFRDIYANETPGAPENDVETVAVQVNPVLLSEPKLFFQLRPEPPITLPAPQLINSAGNNTTVTLNFTGDLYQLTATDASNYTVQLDGGGTVTVTSASLSDNKRTVTLTLDSNLSLASAYNVSFTNLTGVTGVPLTGSSTGQFETWDDDPNGIKVFILAGQSNMVGYGHAETGNGGVNGAIGSLRYLVNNDASYPEYNYTSLLETPGDPANSAWATRGNVKVWGQNGTSGVIGGSILKGTLGPFYGATNATAPDTWFGPEYGFGWVIADYYAFYDVLIIKTAWGGHSLHGDFRPPSAVADRGGEIGASYLEMFKNVRQVLDNLDTEFPGWAAGKGYQIVGFGWHQGVSDSSEPFATDYKENLPDLISDVRTELGKPNLPFVIATSGMLAQGGLVESSPYTGYNKVEKAQLWVAGVAQPENVLTSDTRSFWRDDSVSPREQWFHWNQNAESYFLIGKALGDNMVDLLEQ